jgi:hypothetical protein
LADRSAWCTFAGNGFGGEHVMIEFKGNHFERDVILWAVLWYVAYPISYRQLEEMMEEHGVEVDHGTLNRWVLKYVPLLDQEFRARKRPVGSSWRMDEIYMRVKGSWKYLHRAVDKAGGTADFLPTGIAKPRCGSQGGLCLAAPAVGAGYCRTARRLMYRPGATNWRAFRVWAEAALPTIGRGASDAGAR